MCIYSIRYFVEILIRYFVDILTKYLVDVLTKDNSVKLI